MARSIIVADRWGREIDDTPQTYKKANPPKLGEVFGPWAGRDLSYLQLPGGQILQFDLSKLTLNDYRHMRDHYQINVSLTLLTFMMHQLDWHIECEQEKIATMIEENFREMWTRFIRSVSQAYWAGYSPVILQYENDIENRKVVVTKFKDMPPEDARVHWKRVDGWAPPDHARPKINVFDGIDLWGQSWPVPVANSFWYPLLMENGNYSGRKLLRPAFPSWFFSILVHLFANRYYERFGEPVPIGRADFEDEVTVDGQTVSGKQAMETILTNLRSRGVVVLPSDRDPETKEFDYTIEYLESQMRGADFERYLTRLDEEMSLAMFTPLLLLRTGDVGSYNLGVGHMQMYLWMLNALAGDLKEYIDKYVITRLKDFNFGEKAPKATFEYQSMGRENAEVMRTMVTEMVRADKIKPDIEQLGQRLGMTLTEIREVTEPDDPFLDPDDPNADPNDPKADPKADPRVGKGRQRPKSSGPRGVGQPRATGKRVTARVAEQVQKAFAEGTFGTRTPDLGFQRRMIDSLVAEGCDEDEAALLTSKLYGGMNRWLAEVMVSHDQFDSAEDFIKLFERRFHTLMDELVAAES